MEKKFLAHKKHSKSIHKNIVFVCFFFRFFSATTIKKKVEDLYVFFWIDHRYIRFVVCFYNLKSLLTNLEVYCFLFPFQNFVYLKVPFNKPKLIENQSILYYSRKISGPCLHRTRNKTELWKKNVLLTDNRNQTTRIDSETDHYKTIDNRNLID